MDCMRVQSVISLVNLIWPSNFVHHTIFSFTSYHVYWKQCIPLLILFHGWSLNSMIHLTGRKFATALPISPFTGKEQMFMWHISMHVAHVLSVHWWLSLHILDIHIAKGNSHLSRSWLQRLHCKQYLWLTASDVFLAIHTASFVMQVSTVGEEMLYNPRLTKDEVNS